MYSNILIATDGSQLAEKAVSHGLSLAKLAGAKATALIVEPSFNVFGVPESQVRQMPEAYAKHAESYQTACNEGVEPRCEGSPSSWRPVRDGSA